MAIIVLIKGSEIKKVSYEPSQTLQSVLDEVFVFPPGYKASVKHRKEYLKLHEKMESFELPDNAKVHVVMFPTESSFSITDLMTKYTKKKVSREESERLRLQRRQKELDLRKEKEEEEGEEGEKIPRKPSVKSPDEIPKRDTSQSAFSGKVRKIGQTTVRSSSDSFGHSKGRVVGGNAFVTANPTITKPIKTSTWPSDDFFELDTADVGILLSGIYKDKEGGNFVLKQVEQRELVMKQQALLLIRVVFPPAFILKRERRFPLKTKGRVIYAWIKEELDKILYGEKAVSAVDSVGKEKQGLLPGKDFTLAFSPPHTVLSPHITLYDHGFRKRCRIMVEMEETQNSIQLISQLCLEEAKVREKERKAHVMEEEKREKDAQQASQITKMRKLPKGLKLFPK
ncbi:hypothetical protein ADUPG1_011128 [Aduncisulcus paluster]|uniref:Uncharacterized protein n=1 Tax=Aduncisulcus paluster TaxID=2918883 RepID=A0ABQ5JUG0_9EUKA|nr:hypothetical protein ADUPG1_011128 [Aduncisulcus paluster]